MEIEDIINLEEIKVFSIDITCSICQSVLLNPYHCIDCEQSFCFECITNWQKKSNVCPFKCPNFQLKESKMVKKILSKLKLKCPNKCEAEISYDNFMEHINDKCPKIDMQLKIKKLQKQMEELKIEYDQVLKRKYKIPTQQTNLPIKSCQVKIQQHPHPLVYMVFPERQWICDLCRVTTRGSYLCGPCDFDLCEKCKDKNKKLVWVSKSITNIKKGGEK